MADYDDFLYDNFPFAATHPDLLETIGALFGLRPAGVEGCRVLELGCGLGGNLLPMALHLPGAKFVGIDRSVRQIEVGRGQAEALGIKNIDLRAMDIMQVGPSFGTFDYIICHGVYSWVPRHVHVRILDLCRRHLAPHGVAFISFNCLPGWHLRGMLRDVLRREDDPSKSEAERAQAARGLLRFMAKHGAGPAAPWIQGEAAIIDALSDRYLFYEYLVEQNEPIYFTEFATRLRHAGLQYLGDAEFSTMVPERHGPEAAARVRSLAGDDPIKAEQLLDYLSARFFRRALICHEEHRLDRSLNWQRLVRRWIGGRLKRASGAVNLAPGQRVEFTAGDGATIGTEDPVSKATLGVLAAQRPKGLPFEALVDEVRATLGGAGLHVDETLSALVGARVLETYAQGYLEIGGWARPYTVVPGPTPKTCPLVALQVKEGADAVTSMRHESISIDPLDRVLLKALDGAHTFTQLVDVVFTAIAGGQVEVWEGERRVVERDIVCTLVRQRLAHLARAALLLS